MSLTEERFRENGCWYCYKGHEPLLFSFEFDTYVHPGCLRAAHSADPNDREADIMFNELKDELAGAAIETISDAEEVLCVEEIDYWCQCSYPGTDSVTQTSGTCAECGKPVRIYNESKADYLRRRQMDLQQ